MRKFTIEDVARAAGVSTGTVSRVLNGHSNVAARTRDRVHAVMNDLGYAPDPAARHLSWRTGRTLGVSSHLTLRPYSVPFARALERAVATKGLQLLTFSDDLRGLQRFPSAMLLLHVLDDDPRVPLLRARGVPAVVVGHHPGGSWVAPDDTPGAYLATQHLTLAGHRRLALLGDGPSQVQRARRAGFEAAAREARAHTTLLPGGFSMLGGYRAVRQAWEGGARFSGLFAVGDELAAGAIVALADLGVRVPEDVSVMGFDGLPELPLDRALSTVVQDIPRIAAEALTLVLEALRHEAPRGVRVPVRLHPGGTVHPAPRSA
ncbi:LacI family DNA-binding transcriptional regulator [Deinococcus maricopensis]|uniref:Transcriptional regulator, LacI family n=1 Tax=Deinococcus maricopensis (strain DSM 21211 / LMG 22137 / NRRL B-23946 / LB-34) TaxID=709986 RepID=E8U865_DEIML|nr:LacI family DNA-binding transcriptional regulator [Deinococcus maricopensis]ADV67254.1 transcriptional regulator, LacI family [Deinococcus maricopensis DSM 21211]